MVKENIFEIEEDLFDELPDETSVEPIQQTDEDEQIRRALIALEDRLNLDKKNGYLVMYDGLFYVLTILNDGNVGLKKIYQPEIKQFVSKGEWDDIKIYLVKHRNFRSNIKHEKIAGLYAPNGKKLRDFTTKSITTIDYVTGELTIQMPYPEKNSDTHETLDKLLHIITGDMYDTFKNFVAQYVFEDRRGYSRPVLLLYGERGAGKNLIAELFFNSIFRNAVVPLPNKYADYTGYRKARMITIDENETDMRQYKIGRLCKEISGSVYVSIDEKYVPVYQIKNQAYVIVMSNKMPVAIPEQPVSDRDNQWIAVKMETPLNEVDEFLEILKQYPNLNDLFEEQIGSWIEELHEHYKTTMRGKQYGRYGFKIPVTDNVIAMCETTFDINSSDALDLLEKITNDDLSYVSDGKKESVSIMLDLYHNKGFLANTLIRELTVTKPKWIFDFLKTQKACESKPTVMKSNGRTLRGYNVDETVIEKILTINTDKDEITELPDDTPF